MKTFFESGIMKEVPYFINGSGTFYIQELKDADFDKYVYSGDSIKYELDTELVSPSMINFEIYFSKIRMHTIEN